jgi:PBP1b-binding outer membrane lipoprotein LpoB
MKTVLLISLCILIISLSGCMTASQSQTEDAHAQALEDVENNNISQPNNCSSNECKKAYTQ